MSCITTALTWVPQGAAAQFPTRYEFEDQDYERIVKSGRLHLDKAKKDLQEAQKVVDDYSDSAHEAADGIAKLNVGDSHKNGGSDDDLAEYHLDSYDDPTEDSDEEATSMFNNIKSLVYHQPDEADPYITMKVKL